MIQRKFHVEHFKGLLLMVLILVWANDARSQNMLIINAKIRTPSGNDSDVTAISIVNGKIQEMGGSALKARKNQKIIDVHKKGIVYPGFIDAHCHFTGYALDAYKANLYETYSEKDLMQRLKRYADTNKMPYIYGRGWDQNNWSNKEFPEKTYLDEHFPDKIVILKRVDGHAILTNQFTLDKAGITPKSDIEGGQIMKRNGKLTGILIDNAMTRVEALIPSIPENLSKYLLQRTEQECIKDGLTYVVDCGLPANLINLLCRQYQDKKLEIGMTALLASDSNTLATYITKGPFKVGQLSVSGIKIYADGALGSRGACLLQPYTDDLKNYGTMLTSQVEMINIGYAAKRYNWQICTHAIGDSANRTVLKTYDLILEKNNNNRWRIEHAQVVDPTDYHFFGSKNIVPSVQPTHATSDMSWAESRLGKARIHHAYSYKALLDEAGYIALGTDFPVEAINPLATFYAAVARKDSTGNPESGFNAEGKLSREEALSGMTIWAAKSIFQEAAKGSIAIDKDADFTILDTDLMTCREDEILKAKVLYTIIGGKILYKKKD